MIHILITIPISNLRKALTCTQCIPSNIIVLQSQTLSGGRESGSTRLMYIHVCGMRDQRFGAACWRTTLVGQLVDEAARDTVQVRYRSMETHNH